MHHFKFKPETGDPLREPGKSTCLQIAAALYISYNTVKAHLRSIYQKLR